MPRLLPRCIAAPGFDDLKKRPQDFDDPLPTNRRNQKRRLPCRAPEPSRLPPGCGGAERISLAERDNFRLFCQSMAVRGKLLAHDPVGLAGIGTCSIDEMQKNPTTLEVAEEPVAEADALMRPLDQAGNISEHEFSPIDCNDAELRHERGERIVGNLRFRGCDGGEKGRFAGIRKPDDTRIGDQLEPQPDGALFTRLPRVRPSRGAVGRRLEMRVAETAIAAARQQGALAALGEIGEQGRAVLLVDLRADRHFEDRVGPVRAMAILAHAGAAIFGKEMLLIAVVDERIKAVDGFGDDIAPFAAVAAVRTAEFYEFFTPKRHAAVSAVARADIDLGLVEEFHAIGPWHPAAPAMPAAARLI